MAGRVALISRFMTLISGVSKSFVVEAWEKERSIATVMVGWAHRVMCRAPTLCRVLRCRAHTLRCRTNTLKCRAHTLKCRASTLCRVLRCRVLGS